MRSMIPDRRHFFDMCFWLVFGNMYGVNTVLLVSSILMFTLTSTASTITNNLYLFFTHKHITTYTHITNQIYTHTYIASYLVHTHNIIHKTNSHTNPDVNGVTISSLTYSYTYLQTFLTIISYYHVTISIRIYHEFSHTWDE